MATAGQEDPIITRFVTTEDFVESERLYTNQRQHGEATYNVQYQYAHNLIHHCHAANVQRGVALMENLFNRDTSGRRREYMMDIAIGHARLQNYQQSLDHLRIIQEVEPDNPQARVLMSTVEQRQSSANWELGTKVALGVGGIATLVLAGLKGYQAYASRRN